MKDVIHIQCLKYIIRDVFRKENLTLSTEIFPKTNSSKTYQRKCSLTHFCFILKD